MNQSNIHTVSLSSLSSLRRLESSLRSMFTNSDPVMKLTDRLCARSDFKISSSSSAAIVPGERGANSSLNTAWQAKEWGTRTWITRYASELLSEYWSIKIKTNKISGTKIVYLLSQIAGFAFLVLFSVLEHRFCINVTFILPFCKVAWQTRTESHLSLKMSQSCFVKHGFIFFIIFLFIEVA